MNREKSGLALYTLCRRVGAPGLCTRCAPVHSEVNGPYHWLEFSSISISGRGSVAEGSSSLDVLGASDRTSFLFRLRYIQCLRAKFIVLLFKSRYEGI